MGGGFGCEGGVGRPGGWCSSVGEYIGLIK